VLINIIKPEEANGDRMIKKHSLLKVPKARIWS